DRQAAAIVAEITAEMERLNRSLASCVARESREGHWQRIAEEREAALAKCEAALRPREPASDEEINSWDASDPNGPWSEDHAYFAGYKAGWRQAERRLGGGPAAAAD